MNLSCKFVFPCLLPVLLGLSIAAYADSVNLGVDGHLYGEYSLGASQSVSETFTLNQDTEVSSLTFGVGPEAGGMLLNGSFQVIVTGAGGVLYALDEQTVNGSPSYQVTTPLPDILPAGQYDIMFEGGACGDPCYSFVAGIDYYSPALYQGLGGSAQGPFGFELTGDNVPEPGTLVLAGTALAFIPARRYWRRRR
jgi:hypothetical protein